MKVLFDHQAFSFQYFGGVSKCFCELINNMPANVETCISIKESNNVHLKQLSLFKNIPSVSLDQTFIGKYYQNIISFINSKIFSNKKQ